MRQIDLLLCHATVVTMDAHGTIVNDGAVAVHADQIVAVGTTTALQSQFVATQHIDCRGCAVIPGLINAHAHVPMSLLRGVAADLQLDVWLFGYMFPVEGKFVNPAFVRTGTLLSCAEMIRSGTTTFVDMYFFEEEVARACDDAGMRAVCGQSVMRLPSPDAASFDEGLERARAFIAAWHTHPRITPTIAPHAPYTCTDEIYQQAVELCRTYGVPLVTHLSETAREVVESRDQRQDTPIGYANRVGAFDVPCIAAHCVHATSDDIKLLAQRGVGVAPCPTSNLKLASGVAPYVQFLAAGVRTGLGTDGPASNDDQDMFNEIHLAALLPKGLSGDPTAMPAKQAFALATSSGARAIHQDDRIGSLEAGKQADIVVVNLTGLHATPHYTYANESIYNHLVYTSRASDVRDVLVAGRLLMRNNALLTLDEAAITRDARAIAHDIDTFLANREEHLIDKVLAIGTVAATEIFEVQVKAQLTATQVAAVMAALHQPPFTYLRGNRRTQYDTYFLWEDVSYGRLRFREDVRHTDSDMNSPYYTLTLTEKASRVEHSAAIQISRARYTAQANHSERFYREYFQPQHIVTITKERQRSHISYKQTDFAINIDTLTNTPNAGPFLEIKSRTWSRRDAEHKAALIGEILAHLGIAEHRLIKQEYVEQF
ncbi:MAG: amidohydrolase family protein [Roseiflexaceae bacterium]|nr:amidohydrolase [Chloroflexaceae bacterium]